MSEPNLETDIHACTNEEQLEHEIVDCLDEEYTIRSAGRHLLLIGAEVLHANI